MQIRTKRTKRTGRPNRDGRSFSDHAKRSPSISTQPRAKTGGMANAKRNYERYMTLARAAASTGEATEIENLYQHAEHYRRMMREQTA